MLYPPAYSVNNIVITRHIPRATARDGGKRASAIRIKGYKLMRGRHANSLGTRGKGQRVIKWVGKQHGNHMVTVIKTSYRQAKIFGRVHSAMFFDQHQPPVLVLRRHRIVFVNGQQQC